MRDVCSGIINQLVQTINNDGEYAVEAHLVGSGSKNLETQNENEPIDLDYNLNVVLCKKRKLDNVSGMDIKEYVRKMFNKVLNKNGWNDCMDSTSCLTTEKRYFTKGNQSKFSIDLAIVHENPDGTWLRLIHEKTGIVSNDRWYWNEAPCSKELNKKVIYIKKANKWHRVINEYLNLKNSYLSKNDDNHPSFVCYIEAVNNVYNQCKQKPQHRS